MASRVDQVEDALDPWHHLQASGSNKSWRAEDRAAQYISICGLTVTWSAGKAGRPFCPDCARGLSADIQRHRVHK